MAADYLVAQLQPLAFDGPAPYTEEGFAALCREQLGEHPFADLETKWKDLETELRNAAAAERAKALGADPAAWRRPAAGCSLSYTNRITAAFAEKDPAKRQTLIDRTWWDAAGEMTPVTAPLSEGAAFTYAIRLAIVRRRNAAKTDAGNAAFDRLTAGSKIEF